MKRATSIRRVSGLGEGGLPSRGVGPSLSAAVADRAEGAGGRRLLAAAAADRSSRRASTRVQLVKRIDGVETPLGAPQTFNVVPLYLSIMQESDRAAVLDFQKKRRRRCSATVMGADRATRRSADA